MSATVLTLFNPEHDLVLGANEPHYIAPAAIRKMREDLSLLAIWYAPLGSEVYVDNLATSTQFLDALSLKPQIGLAYAALSHYNSVSPWGWNASIVKWLLQRGMPVEALPTRKEIEQIRLLSGRKLAVDLLHALYPLFGKSESCVLHTLQQVEAFVTGCTKSILKEPWSGSGKGLRFGTGKFNETLKGWAMRVLNVQGYLVGEPFYDKVKDFAMEFHCSSKGVRFVGYSIFETDGKGSYQRGILASNELLEAQLTNYVSKKTLNTLQLKLTELLITSIGTMYEGYLGVDMMICREQDGTYWVHPCVEINLRMNMGLVARLFYDQYVCAGSTGYYVIAYEKAAGALLARNQSWQESYPLKLLDNSVVSGYCPLTPVTAHTHYQAYVILDSSLADEKGNHLITKSL